MKTIMMLAVSALLTQNATATVVDFDELNPADRPLYGPANPGFVSNGVTFGGGFYGGWTYSNDSDTTTAGYTNQYAAYTGIDVSGSGNYGIAYNTSVIDLPAGQTPVSIQLTNTTYAALSMLNGDSYAKQFGGEMGDDPDYYEVTFTGYAGAGATGAETGSVTFRLADYTFTDNSLDYVVDTWQLLDLSPLGNAASISLSWESTDVGGYGINTPTYVAVDELVLVPEPIVMTSILVTAGLIATRRRRVD